MTVHCADCPSFVCRGGIRDAGPDSCPMRGAFPDFEQLYRDGGTRELAVRAALVEAEGYGRWTRLREIAEFSHRIGFRRLGIAHCSDMAREAAQVASYFQGSGLAPVLAPCPPGCDPREQARFFAHHGMDLVVVAGMSVAHEALLVHASQVPVVVLIARDLRLRHNPAAALYTSRSYLKDELYGHWSPKQRPPFQGSDIETLERVAREIRVLDEGRRSWAAPEAPAGGDERPWEANRKGEARADGPRTRLAEVMDLAHALGATHLGISFCVGFREEARTLTSILQTNGFRVSSACCKTGAVPKEEVGLKDSQKVRPGRPEMICNPVAQAELLNREGVHFALVLGQCVGHDAATFRHLGAPSACLVAKDRALAHNTVAALP
jgi:uncharacterized metal-binding protein